MKRYETRLAEIVKRVLRSQTLDQRCVVIRTLSNTGFVLGFADSAEHVDLPVLYLPCLKRYFVKVRHALERAETIIDLRVRQTAHSFGAKLFDVERRHHRS